MVRQAHHERLSEQHWGRIRSMASLHEALYRSGIFATVNLDSYIETLASQSFRAMLTDANSIQLRLDLDPVTVSMDQATPCGLLINELISNCLKHGFPNERKGEVSITLKQLDDGQCCLCVSDTGVGLPAYFEATRGNSLGLQLVASLATQLGGALEIKSGSGSAFTVIFEVRIKNTH